MLIRIKKKRRRKRKSSLRAQMTHLPLFGPFLLVTAFHLSPYHILCKIQPIYAIKKWLVSKIMKKLKKLTKGVYREPSCIMVKCYPPLAVCASSVRAEGSEKNNAK